MVTAALAAVTATAVPAAAFRQADVDKLLTTHECVRCDLSGADLFGTDLSRAVLSGSDLSGADLTGALLYFAIIQGADLTDADLTRADLYGADLFDSRFEGVETDKARICHTVMPDGQRSYDQCGGFMGGF